MPLALDFILDVVAIDASGIAIQTATGLIPANGKWYRSFVSNLWSAWKRFDTDFITNSNGSSIRFGDGTQITWGQSLDKQQTLVASGALFQSNTVNLTYASPFISPPVISIGTQFPENVISWGAHSGVNSTYVSAAIISTTNTAKAYLTYTAIGRYK